MNKNQFIKASFNLYYYLQYHAKVQLRSLPIRRKAEGDEVEGILEKAALNLKIHEKLDFGDEDNKNANS